MAEESPENIDNLSFDKRMEFFFSQEVIDVTEGFRLVHDSVELMEFMVGALEKQYQGRFPILGINGRVYMQGGRSENNKFQHREILNALKVDESAIEFATGLESITQDERDPHLKLTALRKGAFMKEDDVVMVLVAKDTDLHVAGSSIAGPGGYDRLVKIFGGISGVEVVTPQSWKVKKE
jgi:hypothetical protein